MEGIFNRPNKKMTKELRSLVNITTNETGQILPRGRRRKGFQGRYYKLSADQRLAQSILSVGIMPFFCILGLTACTVYLISVWRRRQRGTINYFPIIISVFDAIYLLLTLGERIEHALITVFEVYNSGIPKEVNIPLKRISKCALSTGVMILCIHSIEGCYAMVRPMTYKFIWTKRNRIIISSFTIGISVSFFASCQIAYHTIKESHISTFFSVRNSLEDGLFSVLTITLMLFCNTVIIIQRRKQTRFRSIATTSHSTDNLVRLLLMTGTVYFLLGVPVDVAKMLLVYGTGMGRKDYTLWLMLVSQKTIEVVFGSVLLCVYVLHEIVSGRYPCCFSRKLQRMLNTEQIEIEDAGKGVKKGNEYREEEQSN